MNKYIKPVFTESWPEAQGIHGISPQTVAHSSTFADQVPAIKDAIRDRVVAVYNAEFELQFLPSHVVVVADLFVCVMELYREIRGLRKYVKNTYRLQNAMDWCGFRKSQAHRAMEDNLGTIAVWDKLREQEGRRFENAVSRHCYYVY
ncbi:MAG: 3'-5' exonuclease [Gemmatimonadota bacterium]|nr:3'-5' exonuclease [Gemmatimonadota bacterium]